MADPEVYPMPVEEHICDRCKKKIGFGEMFTKVFVHANACPEVKDETANA